MAAPDAVAQPRLTQDVPYPALNGWWALSLALVCLALAGLSFLGGLG